MRKQQRTPVQILPDHQQRYIELAKEPISIAKRIARVQQEFNLPVPHTDSALIQFYDRAGIKPERASTSQGVQVEKASVAGVKRAGRSTYTWSEHQEALLKTFLQAKEAERLAEENWRLRNQVAAFKDALNKKDKQLRSSQEYELLVKQGQIPAPLTAGRKNKPNLTYHIKLYELDNIANPAPLLNISEGAFVFN